MTSALPFKHKPFNLEHAKAGAPFSGSRGELVRVLIWDRKYPGFPIVAIEEAGDQEAVAFRADGTSLGQHGVVDTLVMTPLGYIDGLPVFVGDEVETNSFSIDGSWEKVAVKPGDHGFTTCRWPAPEEVYPETTIDATRLVAVYETTLNGRGAGGGRHAAVLAIANAALRDAIDAGQVVMPGTVPPQLFLYHVQKKETEGERFSILLQAGQHVYISQAGAEVATHAPTSRTARDMAIAEAVRKACLKKTDGGWPGTMGPGTVATTIHVRIRDEVDLAAVIAKVTK